MIERDPNHQKKGNKRSVERAAAARASTQPVTDFFELFHTEVLDEEKFGDVRDNGESIDEHWATGWTVASDGTHRSNYCGHAGRWVKTFPTRYRLADFHFSKSMRRVLATNEDLHSVVRPLRITPAKESLYIAHHLNRFQPPREPLVKTYENIVHNPTKLMEICFFERAELVAFSIFELGESAIKSDAGVWLPQAEHRSLGTLTILKEVEYARSLGFDYYYLGHYYLQNPAYAYKTRFSGLELYDWDNERWVRYEDPYTTEMLQQKLPKKDYSK